MAKPTISLLHGYNSTAASHWFPWLARELKKEGYSFEFIQMPNPGEPNLTTWLATLEREIQDIDRPRIFIAHSLGCITLLQSLASRNFQHSIGGIILVSGFSERLASLPSLDSFISKNIDYPKLRELIQERMVLSARNDTVVPTHMSQDLATELAADFMQQVTGGHFLAEDGVLELPIVLEVIKEMSEKLGKKSD